jgi:hypothetical protein
MMQLKVGNDGEWYCIYLELWRYDVTEKILNILMLSYYTRTGLSYDFVTLVKQVYHKKYRLGTNFVGKLNCFLQPVVFYVALFFNCDLIFKHIFNTIFFFTYYSEGMPCPEMWCWLLTLSVRGSVEIHDGNAYRARESISINTQY